MPPSSPPSPPLASLPSLPPTLLPTSSNPVSSFADLVRRALAPSAVILLLVLGAAPAAWAEPDTEAAEALEATLTPAEYYAAEMAERPEGAAVIVDDVMAGRYDTEELEADLHEAFGALDVPYYVVAGPFPDVSRAWGDGSMLAPLADRVGEDGLYVHLVPGVRGHELETRGLDLAVSDEDGVYALADDPGLDEHSTIDEVATVIVERLRGTAPLPDPVDRSGPGPLASFWEGFLSEIDPTSRVGPENLGTLTGLAAGFLVGSGVLWIWWRRATGRAGLVEISGVSVGAVALAVLSVAGPYAHMMSVPKGGSEIVDPNDLARTEEPYVLSTERIERLLAELESEPLYVAPLLPLPKDGLAAAGERLAEAELPVRAVVLPMHDTDESQGDPEVLAYALSALTEGESVHLVVVERFGGEADVAIGSSGLGIDPFELGSATRGVSAQTPAEALNEVLPALEGMSVDPDREDAEPPFADRVYEAGPRGERFFDEGFFPCLIFFGPFLAFVLFGVAYVVVHLLRKPAGGARTRMSEAELRKLAVRETRAMARELESAQGREVPSEIHGYADTALAVLRRPTDGLDLLGVVVLARRVRSALADDLETSRKSVCAVNPLHGHGPRRGRISGVPDRKPVCMACWSLPESTRNHRVLKLKVYGAWVPHITLDRVWVHTNYGTTSRELLEGILEKSDD